MVKTKREIKAIIGRYKEELKKLGIRPQRGILYGSYARGHPREDRDPPACNTCSSGIN